jgi:hypothetical protein
MWPDLTSEIYVAANINIALFWEYDSRFIVYQMGIDISDRPVTASQPTNFNTNIQEELNPYIPLATYSVFNTTRTA